MNYTLERFQYQHANTLPLPATSSQDRTARSVIQTRAVRLSVRTGILRFVFRHRKQRLRLESCRCDNASCTRKVRRAEHVSDIWVEVTNYSRGYHDLRRASALLKASTTLMSDRRWRSVLCARSREEKNLQCRRFCSSSPSSCWT